MSAEHKALRTLDQIKKRLVQRVTIAVSVVRRKGPQMLGRRSTLHKQSRNRPTPQPDLRRCTLVRSKRLETVSTIVITRHHEETRRSTTTQSRGDG